jgi:hypothetical protein
MADIAARLRELGVKNVLVTAAEEGRIETLECAIPECLCPRGRGYFEPVTPELRDWIPTIDHYPKLKHEGGHRTADNVRLAHRLCNRVEYSKAVDRPYQGDLDRVEAERRRMEEEAPP